ncbi:unnamed protein product, partial [Didymodactylos carnosus]
CYSVTKCSGYTWCETYYPYHCYSTSVSLTTAGIVGVVIGSLVGLSLLITCIVCICRSITRRNAQRTAVMVQYPVGSGGIVYPNQPPLHQGYPNQPPLYPGYSNQPPLHKGYPNQPPR